MMGMRPDFGAAMMQVAVMVKQAVPLLLALGALRGGAAAVAARAAASAAGRCVLPAVPAMLAVAVARQLMMPAARRTGCRR